MIIEALEPKNRDKHLLDFTPVVKEYIGCEIIRFRDYRAYYECGNRPKFRITSRDELRAGDVVVLWPGYRIESIGGVVKDGDCWYANTGGCTHSLEFAKDDRNCWISTTIISNAAIEKLEIS